MICTEENLRPPSAWIALLWKWFLIMFILLILLILHSWPRISSQICFSLYQNISIIQLAFFLQSVHAHPFAHQRVIQVHPHATQCDIDLYNPPFVSC